MSSGENIKVQQCHRTVNKIKDSLEEKKMCVVFFLDIQQPFNNVWHLGLLNKLKTLLPDQLHYLLLISYMHNRFFQVKIDNTMSALYTIKSGVSQTSILGLFLQWHSQEVAEGTAAWHCSYTPEIKSLANTYCSIKKLNWLSPMSVCAWVTLAKCILIASNL